MVYNSEVDRSAEAVSKKGHRQMEWKSDQTEYAEDRCAAAWNQQAVICAGSYLDFSAFSYKGLIEQLELEQFTREEAVYGAEHCGANWKEQAVKSAKSYLDTMSFSKAGLISQLEFEGFTHEEAVYGAEQNGFSDLL